ncbi:AMP-binding protein [Alphaproteobacteria bacterium]|nr:AMP-binding protein [Alphaproteobacteria bacterium]
MDRLINRLINTAIKHHNKTFIITEQRTWTYKEAWFQICSISSLISSNYKSKFIPIFSDKSIFYYFSIVAVLLSGRAYVPLSPKDSNRNIKEKLKSLDVEIIISSNALFERINSICFDLDFIKDIILEQNKNDKTKNEKNLSLTSKNIIFYKYCQNTINTFDISKIKAKNNITDYIYMIFTSGSTGNPKGIAIKSLNVTTYLDSVIEKFSYSSTDLHTQIFELTFDLSVHDMMCAWTTGGGLVPIYGKAIFAPQKIISKYQITCWFSVPAVGFIMQKSNGLKSSFLKSLRVSLFCGEPLPSSLADAWLNASPGSILENLYGPTEATIAFTSHRFIPNLSKDSYLYGYVPIGLPFKGLKIAVMNENKISTSGECKGELLLGGGQLFEGYWKNDELNKTALIQFKKTGSQIWYRTGDIVVRNNNGIFYYVGRIDSQIKLNGYRVELGEVENALRHASQSQLVAVVPWPLKDLNIIGITAIVSSTRYDDRFIMDKLKKLIPTYMLPQKILIWDLLPLNNSGKIDKKSIIEKLKKDYL